jgi:hypothetical protein
MKKLIEDYKRRLKNIDEMIKGFKSNGSENDIKKGVRLTTKASEYRTIIAELECLERNVQTVNVQLTDQTPQLISRIDFSTLRTQKKTLIEIIDDMEKRGVESERVRDLDGILNLIDCIQDFATDVMGLNPIDVYDFELEENREDVVKPTKTVTLCKECNTDDVIINKIDGFVNRGYCMICGKDVDTYVATLKTEAKVIGYQVRTDTDDCALHPKMDFGFTVFNLRQCQKIVGGETANWKIRTVWSGDIEEPTIMFRGNPDNNHKK